jgi:hypothetical protein
MAGRDGSEGAGGPGGVGGPLRLPAIVVVAALVAAGAVVAGRVGARQPPRTSLQPTPLASEAAPLGAQSSSWYCTGGTGTANAPAAPTVLLVNAGSHRVAGSLEVVDATGTSASEAVTVPAHGQVDEDPGKLVGGSWAASRVHVDGGGVSASTLVEWGSGWTVAPCASETSSAWYFATGSTADADATYVSLYNPSANLAVVDLSFVTASGETAPQPFQGIVIRPGAAKTLTLGTYVQNQKAVATEVEARSGAVVASELELFGPKGSNGIAFRVGAPAPAAVWDVPRALDQGGGYAELAVFNPTTELEKVKVEAHLSSGRTAPFEQTVPSHSVWTLPTSQQVGIPPASGYSLDIEATGPGVVVERTDSGPATAKGAATSATPAVSTVASEAATRWIVPAVGASPHGPGPRVTDVVVQNPSRRAVEVTVSALRASGVHRVARVRVPARSFVAVSSGAVPLLVVADRPVAVAGDASPPAEAGFLTIPAIPQR